MSAESNSSQRGETICMCLATVLQHHKLHMQCMSRSLFSSKPTMSASFNIGLIFILYDVFRA